MGSYEANQIVEDRAFLYELACYWDYHYRAPTVTELAERLGKHPASVSAKIKRLHGLGCVTIYPLKKKKG